MTTLRAMTFNVRQLDGDDGNHCWDRRRDAVVETIASRAPDLLGTQEIHREQSSYLLSHFPEYAVFGRGRYGDTRDKHNQVFYRRERLVLLESGETWFSTTPEVPGSRDWGIPKPRMITWGRLRDSAGAEIAVLNTHLPYGREADHARRQAARLIREQLLRFPVRLPALVMGDFNAPAGGEIYHMLTTDLEDAWTAANCVLGPEGTLHGFGRLLGGRIDWILYRHLSQVHRAETITDVPRGVYPSDHYPVCVTFAAPGPQPERGDVCKLADTTYMN